MNVKQTIGQRYYRCLRKHPFHARWQPDVSYLIAKLYGFERVYAICSLKKFLQVVQGGIIGVPGVSSVYILYGDFYKKNLGHHMLMGKAIYYSKVSYVDFANEFREKEKKFQEAIKR